MKRTIALAVAIGAAAAAAVATAAPIAADRLLRVHLSVDDAAREAARFEAEGWDVYATRPEQGAVELIVSRRDLAMLLRRGYHPIVLDAGKPLAQSLHERFPTDALPAGYRDLAGLVQAMLDLQNAYPTICQRVDLNASLGTPSTWEGRPLYALKISDNVATDEDEPTAFIVACHHAREITTPEAALDAAQYLLANYGGSTTGYVDRNEIWIVPVANPDGYNRVVVQDNYWRKNVRETCAGTANDGVDTNRNYDKDWSTCGGSTNPCDYQLYRGPSAGSEPEVQTIKALNQREHFAVSIDYHSYGEDVLWGYYGAGACPQLNALLLPPIIDTRNALMAATGFAQRTPSAGGEHYEWQVNQTGAHAFLLEIDSDTQGFQPPYSQVPAIVTALRPAITLMLDRIEGPQIRGHVREAGSGNPLVADVVVHPLALDLIYPGELRQSVASTGRYQWMVLPGTYCLTVTKTGYRAQGFVVSVGNGPVDVDVNLAP